MQIKCVSPKYTSVRDIQFLAVNAISASQSEDHGGVFAVELKVSTIDTLHSLHLRISMLPLTTECLCLLRAIYKSSSKGYVNVTKCAISRLANMVREHIDRTIMRYYSQTNPLMYRPSGKKDLLLLAQRMAQPYITVPST